MASFRISLSFITLTRIVTFILYHLRNWPVLFLLRYLAHYHEIPNVTLYPISPSIVGLCLFLDESYRHLREIQLIYLLASGFTFYYQGFHSYFWSKLLCFCSGTSITTSDHTYEFWWLFHWLFRLFVSTIKRTFSFKSLNPALRFCLLDIFNIRIIMDSSKSS